MLACLSRRVPMVMARKCAEGLVRQGAALGGPFPVVVSAGRTGVYKPDPRLHRLALAELELPPAPGTLPKETGRGRLATEVWEMGLAMTAHLITLQRVALDARRGLPVVVLGGVPSGREVTVAGWLVPPNACRQPRGWCSAPSRMRAGRRA